MSRRAGGGRKRPSISSSLSAHPPALFFFFSSSSLWDTARLSRTAKSHGRAHSQLGFALLCQHIPGPANPRQGFINFNLHVNIPFLINKLLKIRIEILIKKYLIILTFLTPETSSHWNHYKNLFFFKSDYTWHYFRHFSTHFCYFIYFYKAPLWQCVWWKAN